VFCVARAHAADMLLAGAETSAGQAGERAKGVVAPLARGVQAPCLHAG
jgi:hypothetical protein